jgi:SAM-dependent methyltransferase
MADPDFRADLFRGTALSYDAYRPTYPRDLIDDLAARSGADGTGRLLDLACGTGHVAFALRDRFAEVWAVDQEPDMIELASLKAAATGHGPPLLLRTCAAEELAAPEQSFDLVTIGNAFHRLRRQQVADRVLRWLRPGGYLALLWGGSPVEGGAPWQQTLQATMQSWHDRNGVAHQLPPGYQAAREATPDLSILRAAGFEVIGRFEFAYTHEWTLAEIAGYLASTSVWSAASLGAAAPQFDADLRRELGGYRADGRFRQDATFAYDLARRP